MAGYWQRWETTDNQLLVKAVIDSAELLLLYFNCQHIKKLPPKCNKCGLRSLLNLVTMLKSLKVMFYLLWLRLADVTFFSPLSPFHLFLTHLKICSIAYMNMLVSANLMLILKLANAKMVATFRV